MEVASDTKLIAKGLEEVEIAHFHQHYLEYLCNFLLFMNALRVLYISQHNLTKIRSIDYHTLNIGCWSKRSENVAPGKYGQNKASLEAFREVKIMTNVRK